jgi:hypothetical protein
LGTQTPQIDVSRAFALAAQQRQQALSQQATEHSMRLEDERLRMAQDEAAQRRKLQAFQMSQMQGERNALADYNKAYAANPNDPNAISKLAAYPEMESRILALRNQMSENDKAAFDQKMLRNARRAQYVMGFEGDAKTQAWQQSLKDAADHGDISPEQFQQLSQQPPNDLMLHNIQSQAVPIQELYRAQEPTAEMRNLKAAGIEPTSPQGRTALLGGKKFQKTDDGRIAVFDPAGGEPQYITPPQPEGGGGSGYLSDAAAMDLATQYNLGDKSVLTGLGTRDIGNKNRAKVLEFAQKLRGETGTSAEDLFNRRVEYGGKVAAERVGATQERKMETAAKELESFIPAARGVIERLPRTSFLPWNRLVQAYQENTLNPDQAELHARTQAIINAYAAIIGRGSNVVTVSAQQHAESLLNTAGNAESYNRVLDTLAQEAELAVKAPGQAREENRLRASGGGGAPSGNAPPSGGGAPIRVNSADEARQLIQSGKLKSGDHFTDENGIDRVVH